MAFKQIVLSPELANLAQNLLQLPHIPFSSEDNDSILEKSAEEFLAGLPKGIIGFCLNGRFFLRKDLINLLPDLEKDFIFPKEQNSD